MSLWKRMTAKDSDGTTRDVHCDPEGNLVTIPHQTEHGHEGYVFQISIFFGEIADDAETNLLIQVGSTNDLHLIDILATTDAFWELEMFEGPEFTAAGTSLTAVCNNRFIARASDATWSYAPTLVATTVDAASGPSQGGAEKVLNVTATTNFVVGTWILIDKGEANNNEFAQIASIQAGVSLTMESNLVNDYTNEAVESVGFRMAYTHTEGGEKAASVGATASTGGHWVFKSGEDYLLRMTNRGGAAKRASNVIWWGEHTKQS